MKQPKLLKREEHEKFTPVMEKVGLIRGDYVLLISEDGNYINATVRYINLNGDKVYTGRVEKSSKNEDDTELYDGDLIDFELSNCFNVRHMRSMQGTLVTLDTLSRMLKSGQSTEEILKVIEVTIEHDICRAYQQAQAKSHGSPIAYWQTLPLASLSDINY